MRFGLIPLALQFAVSVGSWMVKSRVGAAAAAEYAAAEFDYFKSVSDGELTQISFEMAREFPEYPYWEWFAILKDLRTYGMYTPSDGPAGPANGQPPLPDKSEKKTDYTWLLVGAGVLVVFLLSEGR